MKGILCFFTLAASLFTFFLVSPRMPFQAVAAKSASAPEVSSPETPAALEPLAVLSYPETIEDELLLKGLETLALQETAIRLWDGKILTGRELADFVKNNNIPLLWGNEQVCGGASCSLLYFRGGGYIYEDGQPGVDPIYINPSVKDQSVGRGTRLLRELSHEIFHRMCPFGSVNVTRYEEFWAFSVETQLTQSAWPVFSGYDPQEPASLEQWFTSHNLTGYLSLEAYPQK